MARSTSKGSRRAPPCGRSGWTGGLQMKVMTSEEAFDGRASVVALGMFDGVHVGHQRLIREAVRLARELDAQSVVCTFDRHPLSVICPARAPEPVLTLAENLAKFEALGADCALVTPFTPEFSQTPPEDYLRSLVEHLRVRAVVVGENYTFGRGGMGDAAMVRRLAGECGYLARVVEPVRDGEGMVSSTRIRAMLQNGELARAQALLAIRPEE